MTHEPERVPLAEVIARGATADPGRIAVASSTRTWTHGDLETLTRAAARLSSAANGRDGGPPLIAVRADTRSVLAVSVAATAAAARALPLAMDLLPEQRIALFARAQPVLEIDGHDLVAASADQVPATRPTFDDAAIILGTSGSGGEPKLVPNTHRNLWASARFAAQAQGLGPDDRCLALGSMAHVLGLRTLTDALWCGATVVIPDELTVADVAELLRVHRPTCAVAPPPLLHTLAAAVESLSPADRAPVAESLRYVRSGAAALRDGLIERLQAHLGATKILHGYGMTEVAKIACSPLDGGAPAGSVGRPLGVELRIDTAVMDGRRGDTGEILVRGDVVTPGYLDARHSSASRFEDGWFRTGDLGRLDAAGNLFLLGRRDDVVSRGGVLVSLDALEVALETHHAVRSALAAAVDHPNLGTDVVLAYTTVGAAPVDASSLREYLQRLMTATQVPTRIVHLEAIPLLSSGKPSRVALADLVMHPPAAPPLLSAHAADPETDGVELRLAALWRDLLLVDRPVLPDDDLFALGADSLHLVELCTMVSETFGAEVLPGELIGRSGLRDMAALVRDSALRRTRPILVPLRSGASDRLPLYIVPGAGGTLAALQRFVFELEAGRRVVGYEAPGLYPGEEAPTSTADFAERYVDELLQDVGSEPYALLGASFGSVVVQDMARRLEILGRPPALLVMFDCPVPGMRKKRQPFTRAASRLVRLVRPRPPTEGMQARINSTMLISRAARAMHRPEPTSVPTLMYTSRAIRRWVGDPLLGWQPYLLGPVETIGYPGTHLELLRDRAAETGPQLDLRLVQLDREAFGQQPDRV